MSSEGFWRQAAAVTALKLLLVPAYFSTDFDVHQNWLNITGSSIMSEWYYDERSQWTLDYPPFFAYFEFAISKIATIFGIDCSLNTWDFILFHRVSVIATDLLLFVAIWMISQTIADGKPIHKQKTALLLLFNYGLLIIDHIHFQYNGFLLALLLISIVLFRKNEYVGGAIVFSILLNLKHIFLYLLPAFFVFILRGYCFDVRTLKQGLYRFFKIASVTSVIFAVSFAPFYAHLPQVLSRLFPFRRGLLHAYWAPNFWSLYAFLDRLLTKVLNRADSQQSLTRGLVGDVTFSYLPQIKPFHSLMLTIVFQSPSLMRLWKKPSFGNFLLAITTCAYASFLFSWHVHEKAVLLIIFPLMILQRLSQGNFEASFILVQLAGNFSLLPLLHEPRETPLKTLMFILYSSILGGIIKNEKNYRIRIYSAGLILVQILAVFLPISGSYWQSGEISLNWLFSKSRKLPGAENVEFLPLMFWSVSCAIGILWSVAELTAPLPKND